MADRRVFNKLLVVQAGWTVVATTLATVAACIAGGVTPLVAVCMVVTVGSAAALSCVGASLAISRRLFDRTSDIVGVLDRLADGDNESHSSAGDLDLLAELQDPINRTQDGLRSRISVLERSQDQLRTVLDSMEDGVIAVDREQIVRLVNHAVCRMFRFQEAGAIGRPLYELIRNPQLLEWVSDALAGGQPSGGELSVVGALSRHLQARVAGVAAPSTTGAVVVVSDLSELRHLESVRQEFVANASHELKTPLASISACVETLIDGAAEDPESCRHFLGIVNEQAARMARLVQDMLALTRLESAAQELELETVSLTDVVETVRQRHTQNANRKRIDLRIGPGPEDITLFAEIEAVEHILDNLLDNAIKYTNDEGTVELRWRVENDDCVVDVEDTGIGIPQAQLNRVFERFYRVDRARSREVGGTGLGLSIVKHMVQAIGGTVTVSSRVGRGTVFSVRMKLSRVAPAEAAEAVGGV
jgi:two-component system, OmpR family, phosphate regulon sensor histidine kinase PhoR